MDFHRRKFEQSLKIPRGAGGRDIFTRFHRDGTNYPTPAKAAWRERAFRSDLFQQAVQRLSSTIDRPIRDEGHLARAFA